MPKLSTRHAAILVVSFLGLWGCSEDKGLEQVMQKYYDEELASISPQAALARVDIKIARFLSCLLDETFSEAGKESGERDSATDDIVDEIRRKYTAKCSFFVRVDEQTATIVEQIKKIGQVTEPLYSFKALEFQGVTPEGDIYRTNEIGVFFEEDRCVVFELMARATGMPTTGCAVIQQPTSNKWLEKDLGDARGPSVSQP